MAGVRLRLPRVRRTDAAPYPCGPVIRVNCHVGAIWLDSSAGSPSLPLSSHHKNSGCLRLHPDARDADRFDQLAESGRACAHGRRHRSTFPSALPPARRRTDGLGDGVERPAAARHPQDLAAHRPHRRARAPFGADRRRGPGASCRRGAIQRRARRRHRRHQHGLSREERYAMPRRVPRCCRTRRSSDASWNASSRRSKCR